MQGLAQVHRAMVDADQQCLLANTEPTTPTHPINAQFRSCFARPHRYIVCNPWATDATNVRAPMESITV